MVGVPNDNSSLVPDITRRRRPAPILLSNLGPWEQLRAGRLPRRVIQLAVGLWLYGWSMAMMLRAALGVDPWDVLHSGLARHLDLSFGAVVTIAGAVVLLLWIPLRRKPGLGTVANIAVIGVATDVGLSVISTPALAGLQALLLVGGVLLNGLAGALYIGAQLGPGPRDGLMTGLAARTGWPIRRVRTMLELGVLAVGFALGGPVGVGTVLYALALGPVVQAALPHVLVPLRSSGSHRAVATAPAPTT